MSILPVIGASIAIDLYSFDLAVQDFVYITNNGMDLKEVYGTRTSIQAAVDPSSGRNLERVFGAGVSDGDIGIYTKEQLYLVDIYEEGELRLQTIVTYDGFPYSVKAVQNWKIQADCYIYLAGRYVNQVD